MFSTEEEVRSPRGTQDAEDSTETTPLLSHSGGGNSKDDKNTSENNTTCHRPKLIEPLVFLFCCAYISGVPILEQYVNYLVSLEYPDCTSLLVTHSGGRFDKLGDSTRAVNSASLSIRVNVSTMFEADYLQADLKERNLADGVSTTGNSLNTANKLRSLNNKTNDLDSQAIATMHPNNFNDKTTIAKPNHSAHPIQSYGQLLTGGQALNIVTAAAERDTCIVSNTSSACETARETRVQQMASLWLTAIKLASALPAVVSVTIIVASGDRTGRRLGLFVASLGCGSRMVLAAWAQLTPVPLGMLVLGGLVEGVTGGPYVFTSTCYTYLADVTPAHTRPFRFLVMTMISLLPGLASIPMGHWVDTAGFQPPLYLFAGLLAVCALYVVFLLPESRPSPIEGSVGGETPPEALSICRVFGKSVAAFRIYSRTSHTSGTSQAALILLLCAYVSRIIYDLGKSGPEILFVLAPPFCFTPTTIGYLTAFSLLVQGTAGVLLEWVLRRCHVRPPTMVLVFTASSLLARVLLAFSTHTASIFIVNAVGFGEFSAVPVIKAIMSQRVSLQHQGALLGSMYTLVTLAAVVSPLVFNGVYAATVATFRGTAFLVQAVFLATSICFVVVYSRVSHHEVAQAATLSGEVEGTTSIVVNAPIQPPRVTISVM